MFKKKYLKYKQKYLELKNQTGGILDCYFLKEDKTQTKNIDDEKKIEEKNLLNARKLIENILSGKCNSSEIKKFGEDILIKAEKDIKKLKNAGLNLEIIIKHYQPKDLIKAGLPIEDFIKLYPIQSLKDAGVNLEAFSYIISGENFVDRKNLAEVKYTLDDYKKLKKGYLYEYIGPESIYNDDPQILVDDHNFTLVHFKLTKWKPKDLRKVNFKSRDKDGKLIKTDDGKTLTFTPTIKDFIDAGFISLIDLNEARFTIKELKEYYTLNQFLKNNIEGNYQELFTIKEIMDIYKYKYKKRSDLSMIISNLRRHGFKLLDIVNEISEVTRNELLVAGFDKSDIKTDLIDKNHFNLNWFVNKRFNFKDLKDLGFKLPEIIKAYPNFRIDDLLNAGYKTDDIKEHIIDTKLFSLNALIAKGFTLDHLLIFYEKDYLKKAGKELPLLMQQNLGSTPKELLDMGYK